VSPLAFSNGSTATAVTAAPVSPARREVCQAANATDVMMTNAAAIVAIVAMRRREERGAEARRVPVLTPSSA
jgi:hypothetical protein